MANFTTSNGQIIDPNGQTFIAKGINMYASQLGQASDAQSLFPGANMVRLAVEDLSTTPDALQSFVNQMTSAGIVVEIEDHSPPSAGYNLPTGSDLSNEQSWYANMASAFGNNPYVWLGTMNEPNDTSDESQVANQELGIYNAIRGAGDNNPIVLEQIGGFTDSGLPASDYGSMKNVIWDTHYYGWQSNYSTDQTTVNNALAAQIADAQSITAANGVVPVIIGEYGVSTTGSGSPDPNADQVLSAVHNSGYGSLAWAFSAGTDQLVGDGSALTSFGQEVANFLGTTPAAPPAAPSPSTHDPAPAPTPGTVTVGSGSDSLVLAISEDAYANGDGTSDASGDATFTVSIDDNQVGGTFTATASHSSGAAQDFVLNGDWGPGTHTVGVDFLNDAWDGTPDTDRNLFVGNVGYNGTDTGQNAAFYSGGVQSFSVSGGTTPSVSETSDHGSLQEDLSQTGSYTVGGDTFVLGGGNAASAALGTGAAQINFAGASSVQLTGGSGNATVTADTGNNTFVAGSGSLDVTGGSGADSYVFHAGSGTLTLEDFSTAKGDTLSIDGSLQGSMQQASDGQGGTLITFGTNAGGIDIHGATALPDTSINWV